MKKTYILRIFRGTPENQYFEEFEVPLTPFSNVITGLMHIQKNPVNRNGEKTTPVAWEQGCLEEVCGSCSMLVNGRPRQACTALIHRYLNEAKNEPIVLAPLSKFPLIKDLMVDRSQMFENLKKAHAWVSGDGAYDFGPGPAISPALQDKMYELSTCMTCGCCLEACPQVNENSSFVGPQVIAQVDYFNLHPVGKEEKNERLSYMKEEGGVLGCGKAQNCEKVCPKEIPLVRAIAEVSREVTLESIKVLFES